MRIGMLTGGGDCPGLNAVIRAVVRKGVGEYGHTIVGYRHGWRGPLEGESMDLVALVGARAPAARRDDPRHVAHESLQVRRRSAPRARDLGARSRRRADRDRRRGHARRRAEARKPTASRSSACRRRSTTISSGTDFTFGFHTAVQIATDAIDRLHTTAESHDRVMVVEVMGRHAGWIATYSGMAGGADIILIPEEPFDIDEICDRLTHRHQQGANFSIVVAAEGATPKEGTMEVQTGEIDDFGHVRLGGIGQRLADEIERRTGYEARMTALGHVLRGGSPSAYDRVIATRFGIEAIDAAHEGDFGKMVALRGTEVVRIPIEEGVAQSEDGRRPPVRDCGRVLRLSGFFGESRR